MKKLTSDEALELLEEAKKLNPGRWIIHSKKVGEAAARIAERLNLDVDKARAMGYIHDIGKRFGKKAVHTVEGYYFLKDLGYDVVPVLAQCAPDPNYTNTKSPNPEVPASYELAIKKAKEVDADVVVITDPDGDRLGVVAKHDGE